VELVVKEIDWTGDLSAPFLNITQLGVVPGGEGDVLGDDLRDSGSLVSVHVDILRELADVLCKLCFCKRGFGEELDRCFWLELRESFELALCGAVVLKSRLSCDGLVVGRVEVVVDKALHAFQPATKKFDLVIFGGECGD
jgi:hypothetical protein